MTEEVVSYVGPERRKYTKTIEQLELDILAMFNAHEERERMWVAELRREIREEMLQAFPDGDLKGHRYYHEAKIKAARAEEEFWKAAKSEAIKHGISGLFAVGKWLLILTLLGAAYKFGFGPAAAKWLGVT